MYYYQTVWKGNGYLGCGRFTWEICWCARTTLRKPARARQSKWAILCMFWRWFPLMMSASFSIFHSNLGRWYVQNIVTLAFYISDSVSTTDFGIVLRYLVIFNKIWINICKSVDSVSISNFGVVLGFWVIFTRIWITICNSVKLIRFRQLQQICYQWPTTKT